MSEPEEIYVDGKFVYVTWGGGGYLEIGPEGVVGERFAVDGVQVWPQDEDDFDEDWEREEALAETKEVVRAHIASAREALDELEESL